MIFKEEEFRNPEGATVIRAKLGPAMKRAGWEKKVLLPGIEVGLSGWERSHSQGPGTGRESIHGIVYAPYSVNQELQRLGIERFLRELVPKTAVGTELWLTTETYTYRGTDRLKEIIYKVDAVQLLQHKKVFEASIEVDDQKVNPRVRIEATPFAIAFLPNPPRMPGRK